MKRLWIIFLFLMIGSAWGQIVNNPASPGPVLPSSCKISDPAFYKTSSRDGKPVGVYLCIQPNLWLFVRNAVGTGILSLNGATSQSQTFVLGTNGLSPNWVTADPQQVLNIPLAQMANVTAGLLSNSDYLSFQQRLSLGGDISGTVLIPRVAGLQGFAVSPDQPIAGQVMTWDGFVWKSSPTQNIPDFQTEPANTILASPCFGSGLPIFRPMCLQDLPSTLVQIGGDLGGTSLAPVVINAHFNTPLLPQYGGTGLGSVTNSAVIIGKSTLWGTSVLPNCTSGVLQYTAGTYSFNCNNAFGVLSVSGTASQIAVAGTTNATLSLINPLVTPGFTSSATEFDTTSSIKVGSSFYLKAASNGGLGLGSGQAVVWGASATNSGITGDTGLSRDAAGVLDLGNGTPGNKTGTLNLATLNATTVGVTNINATTLNTATLVSTTVNPAQSGVIRLARTDNLCFRNLNNNGDNCITVNTGNNLVLPSFTAPGFILTGIGTFQNGMFLSGSNFNVASGSTILSNSGLVPLAIQDPIFSVGIANNGTGFQHKRQAACTTTAVTNGTCVASLTWPTAFLDTSYTVHCQNTGGTAAWISHLGGKSTTSINYSLINEPGNAAATSGTIECVGVHD